MTPGTAFYRRKAYAFYRRTINGYVRNCFSKALSLASPLSLLTLHPPSFSTRLTAMFPRAYNVQYWNSEWCQHLCCLNGIAITSHPSSWADNALATDSESTHWSFHTPTSTGFQHRCHTFWHMKTNFYDREACLEWCPFADHPDFVGFGRFDAIDHTQPGSWSSLGSLLSTRPGTKIAWSGPDMGGSWNGGTPKWRVYKGRSF